MLSLVGASRGYFSLRCTGFSLWWLLTVLASLVSEHRPRACGLKKLLPADSVTVTCRSQSMGSAVVAQGLSCAMVCGIFPIQGLNLGPLH